MSDRYGSSPDTTEGAPLRIRTTARRRRRLAIGLALGAVAIGGNVLAYTSLDDGEPVVQAVRDIPAGEQLTRDAFRSVEVELDDDVNAVPADQLDSLLGTYAKVRIVSGSLLVAQAVQADPLVGDGRAVVAVVVPPGELPTGLRERVPVQVVVPPRTATDETAVVDAVTVGLPTDTASALGERSLSIEVDLADAPTIAAADRVRVVLVEPGGGAAAGGTQSGED